MEKGIGKPGKVDDWEAKKAKQSTTKPQRMNRKATQSIPTRQAASGANSTPRIGFESSLEWNEISCLS